MLPDFVLQRKEKLQAMRNWKRGSGSCLLAVFGVLCVGSALLAQNSNNADGTRWSFDADTDENLETIFAMRGDHLEGYWSRVQTANGDALDFDGYTTGIRREAKDAGRLGNEFTVSAWVALDNYPWNWVPIIDQSEQDQIGFFLGVDAFGHVGFGASINGVWQQVTTDRVLPLKKWTHLTAVCQAGKELKILINGVEEGRLITRGNFWQAKQTDLLIGRVRERKVTFPAWISHPQDPLQYSLDGMLLDLQLEPRPVSAEEDLKRVTQANMPEGDVIPYPVLPAGPAEAGTFGAMTASLQFEPKWDRLRRTGPDSDVVVRFDKSAMRLVFWQGTNYIPAWVTEDGKWYTDEFLETWGPGCGGAGDCEPMSDKQSRYSHVSILQSSDARAVIHWRYALAEARNYEGAHPEPRSGWFDWADEYWTVYPDGVGVRKQVLWSSALEAPHEWQETIVINGPGQRPEDNIEANALTLENMAGEKASYHWEPKKDRAFSYPMGPAKLDQPRNANIQIVHLKSPENPFQIVWPRGVAFDTYNGEPSYSMFEWWNHWPVAQVGSSGRPAIAPDRASHSSLSHIYWDPYEKTRDSMTKLLLCGLVRRHLAEENVLPLAKSWISPPEVRVTEPREGTIQYDPSQRAFVVNRSNVKMAAPITLHVDASMDHPMVNPAFVIAGWNSMADVRVVAGGNPIQVPVRFGVERHLDGDDAVIFLEMTANQPVDIKVEPSASTRRR